MPDGEHREGGTETWTMIEHRYWDAPQVQALDNAAWRVWNFFLRDWKYWHGIRKQAAVSLTFGKFRRASPHVTMNKGTFYRARLHLLEACLIAKSGEPKNGRRDSFLLCAEGLSETISKNEPVQKTDRLKKPPQTVPKNEPEPYPETTPKDIRSKGEPSPPTPQGGRGRGIYFKRFWESYPSKKTPATEKDALSAWGRVVLDDAVAHRILADLEGRKRSEQWTKQGGQYIPKPAAYLDNGVWQAAVPVHDERGQSPAQKDPFLEACQETKREHPEWTREQVAEYVEDVLKIPGVDNGMAPVG